MIRLDNITRDNYQECIGLKVADDQSNFVSTNVLSLAKAFVYKQDAFPFVIYNDEIMVGFIMLRKVTNGYLIWQLMIDERYQSRGYAKEALKLAIEWMKKDKDCHVITVTYKKGNDIAEKLYYKFGFQQFSVVEEQNEINMSKHLI